MQRREKVITVILPTYRPENYLWQCLESLSSQTLAADLWEIILVLNGCNEPWRTEIEDHLKQFGLTNAVILQTDLAGVSNARNVGLEHARGEYITFIDDDDYVSETYLEELARIARPDTIAAAYTQAFSDREAYIPYYIEKEYRQRAPFGKQVFYKAKKYFSGSWIKLIHHSIIGETRYDTRFHVGEDALFMFAISRQMQYIAFTSPSAVYYRRLRANSASHDESWTYIAKNCVHLIKAYCQLYFSGRSYSFRFFITRILGAIHTIIAYRPFKK